MKPMVPVAVVVTHNRRLLLVQVIEALLSQTVGCAIVIVDSASTDGTQQIIESYEKKEPQKRKTQS